MWLAILGLLNGIAVGLVYSVKELWFCIFFVLVPFAGIVFSKKRISLFLIGYGLGYYITGLSFLFSLTDVVPLPIYTANVLFSLVILLLSLCLAFLMWLALYPFQFWKKEKGWDIFLLAGLYVLGEWFQEIIPFFSFPWFRLAAVVTPVPIFIQSASLFGSLFVGFLIVLWNAWVARFLMKRRMDCFMMLAAGLIIAVLLYGEVRLYQKEPGNRKVLVVQGNHEGTEKWTLESEDIWEDYKRLIFEYADSSVDLVVMPETALPYIVTDNEKTKQELITISRQLSTDILVGAIQREETAEKGTLFYNVVYHITEEGIDSIVYRKQILVPFGEYLPFSDFFNRVCPWLSEFMSGNYFEAGTEQTLFETKAGAAGTMICYESIFPSVAKEAAEMGAQFFIVVSNDSWFQNTPAMREHYAHAILRAVEQGRAVIRAGNTGISSVIDSRGRVTAIIPENVCMGLQAAVSPSLERTLYAEIRESFIIILFGGYLFLCLRYIWILIFSVFLAIIRGIKKKGRK